MAYSIALQTARRRVVRTFVNCLERGPAAQLPGEQAEPVRVWLEDLRDAADVGRAPLDAVTPASLDRGLADVSERQVKPLDQYERERGL